MPSNDEFVEIVCNDCGWEFWEENAGVLCPECDSENTYEIEVPDAE